MCYFRLHIHDSDPAKHGKRAHHVDINMFKMFFLHYLFFKKFQKKIFFAV